MGNFLSSFSTFFPHIGNQYVFYPPQYENVNLLSDNFFQIINGKYHKIPTFHAKAKTNSSNETCIIYSHGNACDLYQIKDHLQTMADNLGIDVIGYDYTGYGYTQKLSDLKPSELYCVQTLNDVYFNAKKLYKNIVLMGTSVGTGVVLSFTKKLNGFDGKVILETPFTSAFAVVELSCQQSSIDIFPNLTNIKYVKTPAFILHGTVDSVIPHNHGTELYNEHCKHMYAKFVEPYDFWSIKGADHNNFIEVAGHSNYFNKLREYLKA